MTEQKVVFLTGGSDGLGLLAAKKYLNAGWRVVITGRNPDKTAAAVKKLKEETGKTDISYILMDLGSLESVQSAAKEFLALNLPLHVLLNNAGGIYKERQVDPSGKFEMTLYSNFVGTFYLTELLTDKLKSTSGARVLIVTSGTHKPGEGPGKPTHLDFDNLDGSKEWDAFFYYKVSKLANIYHTYLLAPQLESSGVTVNCFCPGWVPTTSLSRSSPFIIRLMMSYVFPLFPITTSEDKSTDYYFYYGTSEKLNNITGDCFRLGEKLESSEESHDSEKGKKLWNLACDVTGLTDRKFKDVSL